MLAAQRRTRQRQNSSSLSSASSTNTFPTATAHRQSSNAIDDDTTTTTTANATTATDCCCPFGVAAESAHSFSFSSSSIANISSSSSLSASSASARRSVPPPSLTPQSFSSPAYCHCVLRTLLLISILLSVWPLPATHAMLDVSWWSSVAQLSTQLNLQQQIDDLRQHQQQQQQQHYPHHHQHDQQQQQSNSRLYSMQQQQQQQSAAAECTELKGLSPGQKRICELFKDHMPAVGNGAKQAISECEWQFRHHRWNCSTPRELKGHIGPVHKRGTREAAFTYAILSAGVTHEIGRRCRLGMLRSCGCSAETANIKTPQQVNEDWTWGGCGDNIDYGYRFSRDFIDVREKEESIKRDAEGHGKSLMNRWNNEVGRKILKRHTKPKCKCHGVSGSCNLKTCWMQLPPIRQIGNILQAKYRSARRIQINSRGNMQFEEPTTTTINGGQQPPTTAALALRQQQQQQQQRRRRGGGIAGGGGGGVGAARRNRALTDLVYLDPSPDYCRIDRNDGTVGTQGRVCSIELDAPNSCDLLCCGRGYESHIEEVISKCNCKFQWCCQVVCDTCRNITEIFTCK